MRQQLGERLPEFSADEQALLHGSNDFYGAAIQPGCYDLDILLMVGQG